MGIRISDVYFLETELMKLHERITALEEVIENAGLLKLAEERLAHDDGKRYTQEEVMKKLGIAQEDLDDTEVNIDQPRCSCGLPMIRNASTGGWLCPVCDCKAEE